MATVTVDVQSDLLPWQREVVSQAKRFNVLAKGRRTGGTSLVEDLMVGVVANGHPVGWLSVTDKLLSESWWRFIDALEPITTYKSEKDHRIEVHGGGLLECWSCQGSVTTRSRKYYAVAIDEAAHVPNLQRIWEQELRPSLMDLKGGAWFPSSPNGHGYFKQLFDKGQDPELPEWASWQIPTTMNQLLDPEEIEGMRADLSPQSFRQEVLAEFVAMEGQCFPDFSRDRHVLPCAYDPRLGAVYVGVDFGYRTFAWVAMQRDTGGTCRVFADGEWRNISTADGGNRIAAQPWGPAVTLVGCDPAGDAVNLQTGIEDVRVLRSSLPLARVAFSTATNHRSPEWRASKLRDLLWSAAETRRLVVDPSCASTIRMFEASVYPKTRLGSGEKQEPVKDGIVDHTRDALGYLVANLLHGSETRVSARRWG